MRLFIIPIVLVLAGCGQQITPLDAPGPQPDPPPRPVIYPQIIRHDACEAVMAREQRRKDRTQLDQTAAACGMNEPTPPRIPGQNAPPLF